MLDVIGATTAYFERSGVESPRLNIEHLLAHVLGKRRIDLYMEFDRPLGEAELGPLRELVKRRAAGEPLQHLLGTVEFCGREFLCDARALVPRPETEQLVELCLKLQPTARIVADLCTGSGVVALSLAASLPEATIHATDISSDALDLARENARRLGLDARVHFHQGDLTACIEPALAFDLIACNPPYIPSGEIDGLSREVRHDPREALDGGADGLTIIRRLVDEARNRLTPGGWLAIEIGHDQADAVLGLLKAVDFAMVGAHPDFAGVLRFVTARYG